VDSSPLCGAADYQHISLVLVHKPGVDASFCSLKLCTFYHKCKSIILINTISIHYHSFSKQPNCPHPSMNITLRQLKVFEAVARHLNYTRAAEELFLS
jgi:hypothetical protein